MGHGAVRARRAHQHDLRRHQHHPVARPAGPQDPDGQRRQAAQVRREDASLRRRKRHRRSDVRIHHAAGRPGRQSHQADDGNRHEGVPESGRSRRRRGAVSARGRPSGVRLLLCADGQDRAGQAGFRRQFLQGQAGHRALLFRAAAAGNRDADPPGALRFGQPDGAGCRPVLSWQYIALNCRTRAPLQGLSTDHPPTLRGLDPCPISSSKKSPCSAPA